MSDLEDNNPTTNSQTEASNPLIHDLHVPNRKHRLV